MTKPKLKYCPICKQNVAVKGRGFRTVTGAQKACCSTCYISGCKALPAGKAQVGEEYTFSRCSPVYHFRHTTITTLSYAHSTLFVLRCRSLATRRATRRTPSHRCVVTSHLLKVVLLYTTHILWSFTGPTTSFLLRSTLCMFWGELAKNGARRQPGFHVLCAC